MWVKQFKHFTWQICTTCPLEAPCSGQQIPSHLAFLDFGLWRMWTTSTPLRTHIVNFQAPPASIHKLLKDSLIKVLKKVEEIVTFISFLHIAMPDTFFHM